MTIEARSDDTFSLRQMCETFAVTPRALRFYEAKGLLTPARDGINRVYHHRDRVRLGMILRGKRVGLSLAEIREILDLYSTDDGGAAQLDRSLKKFRERIVILEAQREDIGRTIAELRFSCARIEMLLAATQPDRGPETADDAQPGSDL